MADARFTWQRIFVAISICACAVLVQIPEGEPEDDSLEFPNESVAISASLEREKREVLKDAHYNRIMIGNIEKVVDAESLPENWRESPELIAVYKGIIANDPVYAVSFVRSMNKIESSHGMNSVGFRETLTDALMVFYDKEDEIHSRLESVRTAQAVLASEQLVTGH